MTTVDVPVTAGTAREAHGEGGAPMELTVAFTDLEDFTSYTEAEGDDTASRLLIGHHRESAAIVRARGGRVLKRLGDGLMLTFPEPEAAVLACLELGEAAPLRLRASTTSSVSESAAMIRLRAGNRHGAGVTPGGYSETSKPRSTTR